MLSNLNIELNVLQDFGIAAKEFPFLSTNPNSFFMHRHAVEIDYESFCKVKNIAESAIIKKIRTNYVIICQSDCLIPSGKHIFQFLPFINGEKKYNIVYSVPKGIDEDMSINDQNDEYFKKEIAKIREFYDPKYPLTKYEIKTLIDNTQCDLYKDLDLNEYLNDLYKKLPIKPNELSNIEINNIKVQGKFLCIVWIGGKTKLYFLDKKPDFLVGINQIDIDYYHSDLDKDETILLYRKLPSAVLLEENGMQYRLRQSENNKYNFQDQKLLSDLIEFYKSLKMIKEFDVDSNDYIKEYPGLMLTSIMILNVYM